MRPINRQASFGISFGPAEKRCPPSERMTDAKVLLRRTSRAETLLLKRERMKKRNKAKKAKKNRIKARTIQA
ncbi:hypothetical protein [Tardiphaga sp. 813_E8_N1_3]|uniref:hypothetical protein n=1 Tax=Tardiphaga sp. 813_E8_N1_3 TaxID=3240760 RepID=UPI003F23B3E8